MHWRGEESEMLYKRCNWSIRNGFFEEEANCIR